MFNNFWSLYLDFWVFSIPITVYILYIIVTEFLDLIFNKQRINKINKYIEKIQTEELQNQYEKQKNQQSNFDNSLLSEMTRQIDYKILSTKTEYHKYYPEGKKIIRAKEMYDIFKIK
nr:DUF6680 family protein [uncultured Flavobacterium sp.]